MVSRYFFHQISGSFAVARFQLLERRHFNCLLPSPCGSVAKTEPDRQLITKRRSHTDARRWVYCLPQHTTSEDNTTENENSTSWDTPPPSSFSSGVELIPENTTGKEEKVSQQQFNTHSTTIQQPEQVDSEENESIIDEAKDIENQQVSQHTTREKGERGGVEQAQSEDILQTALSEEKQSVGVQTKSLPQGGDEQAALQEGDRIMDVLTTIRGTVVAVECQMPVKESSDKQASWAIEAVSPVLAVQMIQTYR